VIDYLREHTEPLAPAYEATINLWLARIDGTDQPPKEHDTVDDESHEPNDYDPESHSEE
jgi:death-on-curing protein